MKKLIDYFDLRSIQEQRRESTRRGTSPNAAKVHWIPQYLAFVFGILIQPYITAFVGGEIPDLEGMLPRLTGSFLLGIVLFPGVYKNAFEISKPIAVQLMAIVPLGVGWRDLWNLMPSG